MWTRLELKEQGRQDFKNDYWAYVLVAFIAVLCTGEHLTFITQQLDIHSYSISTIGTLLSILLLHPLYIGTRRFFLSNIYKDGKTSLQTLSYAFDTAYGNVVLTMFLKNLI